MIVRILGEGQFRVAEDHLDGLNALDNQLEAALRDADDAAFRSLLTRMGELVRAHGTREPDDFLGPSDVTIPSDDVTREELAGLLGDEGLVPG